MSPRRISLILIILLFGGVAGYWELRPSPIDRRDPIVGSDVSAVRVLPFATPFDLDRLPPGWTHRKFWFTKPMQLSFVTFEGKGALRCQTDNSGSRLLRATDIAIADYPLMTWDWFVERPVSGEVDEATPAGDDHPARLYLEFTDTAGSTYAAEVIWSNARFAPGDYKVIGGFQHLVVDGLAANSGKWRAEKVDLEALYAYVSGRSDAGRLITVGLFCDTDNTGGSSIAYTGDVTVQRPPS